MMKRVPCPRCKGKGFTLEKSHVVHVCCSCEKCGGTGFIFVRQSIFSTGMRWITIHRQVINQELKIFGKIFFIVLFLHMVCQIAALRKEVRQLNEWVTANGIAVLQAQKGIQTDMREFMNLPVVEAKEENK